MSHRMSAPRLLAAATLAALIPAGDAAACGCFTPPDPASPIVQSGERIIFAAFGNQITSIIQIQYSGDAKDFGWLLPLPSLPTLELSSDEIFSQLESSTAPTYVRHTTWDYTNCQFQGGPGGASDLGSPFDAGMNGGGGGPGDPLVIQGGIGPYDYAVLKADDKTAMFDWLTKNRYFVPVGTTDVVGPYLHTGAYFLALKLQSGKSTGDLQPVVVRYNSDLPMIPITLTSVTATPAMNVWVWILGDGRAIPRNYYHAVIDDAALQYGFPTFSDSPAYNYSDVVLNAVQSAPRKQAFVTELAQPMKKIKSTVFPSNQFGDLAALAKLTGAGDYLRYLRNNGYIFSQNLVTILQKYIKQPAMLRGQFGQPVPQPSPANYYFNFDYWFMNNQQAFQGFDLSFDQAALTAEINTKIVKPIRDAAALFDGYAYLTRLYTRLDPTDMNRDPVFSFNPFLPDVTNYHRAELRLGCDKPQQWSGTLTTADGYTIPYPNGSQPFPYPKLPGARRIEILREAGQPDVVTDNDALIRMLLAQPMPDGGVPIVDAGVPGKDSGVADAGSPGAKSNDSAFCSLSPGSAGNGSGMGLVLIGMAVVGIVRRRRRNQ